MTPTSNTPRKPDRHVHVISGGRRCLLAGLIFLVFASIYVGMRSNFFMAVDGAVRAMEVYHKNTFVFHGNNHLLYPVHVLAWWRMASWIGVKVSDTTEFIHLAQSMNSFAAAGTLALFFLVLSGIARRSQLALLATIGAGLSAAFLMHGTNSAEVLPGLFFCMLAIACQVETLLRGKLWPLAGAGLLFALSLASYQSMGLAVPLAALLCFLWPPSGASRLAPFPLLWRRLLIMAVSGVLGIVCVFGWAYAMQNIPANRMVRQFFAVGGSPEVYGGASVSHVVNVPFGMARNLGRAVPEDYSGIKSWLAHPQRAFWIPVTLLFLILVVVFAGPPLLRLVRASLTQGTKDERLWSGAFCLSVGLMLVPLFYWDPLYDKFWLQPILLLFAFAALGYDSSFGTGEVPRRAPLYWGVLLSMLAVVNLRQAYIEHTEETPFMAAAKRLAARVGPKDCVVADLDPVSSIYLSFWEPPNPPWIVPVSSPEGSRIWLTETSARCLERGGKIYFVGILDQSLASWEGFIGQKVKIPYSALDRFRQQARVVESFPREKDPPITVREFGPTP